MTTSRYLAEQLLKAIKKKIPDISVSGSKMSVKQNGQVIVLEPKFHTNPYFEKTRRLR